MATKKQFFDFSTREDIIPVVKVTELPSVQTHVININDDFDTAMSKINFIGNSIEWHTPEQSSPTWAGNSTPTPGGTH